MTGMEHAIEQVAEVIRVAIERQADIVADGLHLDVQGVITPHWIAEALATNGLLAQRLPAEGDRSAEPRLNTMRSTDDGETWQWVHTTPAAEGDGRAEQ